MWGLIVSLYEELLPRVYGDTSLTNPDSLLEGIIRRYCVL